MMTLLVYYVPDGFNNKIYKQCIALHASVSLKWTS